MHSEEGSRPRAIAPLSPTSLPPNSGYFRETLRRDIRRVRELFRGEQLSRELRSIQQRLDSVELLSLDIVVSLLLSYRDAQVGAMPPSLLLVSPRRPHSPQTGDEMREVHPGSAFGGVPAGLRLHHLSGGHPALPAYLRRGRAAQRSLPLRLRPQSVSGGLVSPRGGGPWPCC